MGSLETGVAEGADANDLANEYEFLFLYALAVPAHLEQKLREAHRTVHLRGIDPLRKPDDT
jgi:hypothetical protein